MSLDVAPVRRAMARTGARPRRLVRMLRAGSTTPERLSRVAAGLLAGCLLTAVVSVLGGLAHTGAVHESGTRIAALSADAAELYRSLADGDEGVRLRRSRARRGAGPLRRRHRPRG